MKLLTITRFYIKRDDKKSKICVFYTKYKRTNYHSIFFQKLFFKTFCILILVTFLIHTCNRQRSHWLTPHILQHKLWNLNKFPHHQYYLFKFYQKKKTTSLPLSFLHCSNAEPSPPTSLPNVEAFTSHLSLPVSQLKPFFLHCFHKQ